MVPIEKSIQELAALSEILNKKSDELNDVIEAVDAKIAATRPGVTVWLELDTLLGESKANSGTRTGYDLGYTKIADSWTLAVRKVCTWKVDDESCWQREGVDVPLSKAPRNIRAEAVPHLGTVIQAIAEKVIEVIADIDLAVIMTEVNAHD